MKRRGTLVNVSALLANRGLELLLPLITLPFLVKTLGVETYGRVAVAAAFSIYFSGLTMYGFHMTGTRDIAQLSGTVSAAVTRAREIFSASLFLAIAGSSVAALLVLVVPSWRGDAALLLASLLQAQVTALSPSWFFQGMEEATRIVVPSLVSKVAYLLLLLLIVREPGDAVVVPLAGAASGALGLALAIRAARLRYGVRFGVGFSVATFQTIRGGASAATAQLAPSLYNASTTMVLGLTASAGAVGAWSIAVRVVETLCSVGNVVISALTAPLARGAISFRRATVLVVGFGFLLMAAGVALSAPVASYLTAGDLDRTVCALILMLSVWPMAIVWRAHFGVNGLVVRGADDLYRNIVLASSAGGLVASLLFVPRLGTTAAAAVVSGTATLMACWAYLAARPIIRRSP